MLIQNNLFFVPVRQIMKGSNLPNLHNYLQTTSKKRLTETLHSRYNYACSWLEKPKSFQRGDDRKLDTSAKEFWRKNTDRLRDFTVDFIFPAKGGEKPWLLLFCVPMNHRIHC